MTSGVQSRALDGARCARTRSGRLLQSGNAAPAHRTIIGPEVLRELARQRGTVGAIGTGCTAVDPERPDVGFGAVGLGTVAWSRRMIRLWTRRHHAKVGVTRCFLACKSASDRHDADGRNCVRSVAIGAEEPEQDMMRQVDTMRRVFIPKRNNCPAGALRCFQSRREAGA